jgi:hypothetical protein
MARNLECFSLCLIAGQEIRSLKHVHPVSLTAADTRAPVARRIWQVVPLQYLPDHRNPKLDYWVQLFLRSTPVRSRTVARAILHRRSGDFDKELANHPKLQPAKLLGATEVHTCFLARSRPERLDIETDLRRGHWTPLNYQPTPAPLPAYGGLGSLAAAVGIGGGTPGLGSWPPAPPPKNALADLANLAPVFGSFGGYRSPFETDLDWLLRS